MNYFVGLFRWQRIISLPSHPGRTEGPVLADGDVSRCSADRGALVAFMVTVVPLQSINAKASGVLDVVLC